MGRRILFVDDSATVRRLSTRTLTAAGYDVDTASTFAEAMDLASFGTPDLIALNVVLPHMTAVQALQSFRTLVGAESAKVLLMTARRSSLTESMTDEVGASAVLVKPFTPGELLRTVADSFSASTSELPVPKAAPSHSSDVTATDRIPKPKRVSFPEIQTVISGSGSERPSGLGDGLRDALEVLITALHPAFSSDANPLSESDVPRVVDAAVRSVSRGRLLSTLQEAIAVLSEHGPELVGRIDEIPAGSVLERLAKNRRTGVFTLGEDDDFVEICLREGLVDLAYSLSPSDERPPESHDVIPSEALEKWVHADPRGALASQLVKKGRTTRDALHRALVRQTTDLVRTVLKRTRGSFEFWPHTVRLSADHARLGIGIEELLVDLPTGELKRDLETPG